MMTGALALLLAAPLSAATPATPAGASWDAAHAWQPSIFSGRRGGYPQKPPTPAIDPYTGAPNPVVCRTGGSTIFTGRAKSTPVCTVETPEVMAQSVAPTIFSGRLATRERAKVQQEQTQYVAAQQAYVKARVESSGTAYVPPPPPVAKPRKTIRRPSIFTGRRRAPASGQ
jgi:hypothetical protein